MPHCLIEYTSSIQLNANELVMVVHQVMLESGLFKAADIKTRAHAVEHFSMGGLENNQGSFVHVQVYLLTGRSDVQKSTLTQALGECIRTRCVDAQSVSVDIRDIISETYYKFTA
jgi:5-carboxymethyl-2-hydroxymuconate isomerase